MYKVLIVEDEALFQRALAKIIEGMEGYQVIGVLEDGDQALEICAREKPDFICMDIFLPGEDGLSVARKVKARFPSVVIFILSAFYDFRLVQEAMKGGLDAYLTKPYQEEEIRRTFFQFQGSFERENDERERIAKSVGARKICHSFLLCHELSEKVFQECSGEGERYERLRGLAKCCMDHIETLAAGKREHYEKKYRLVPDIQKYRCVAESFLQFLVREIYRLQMISKYPQFNVVLSHVHGNLDREISLNELARLCGMSPGYLTRIFKRYYGIGAVDYIHLSKMIWARLYLACTELSISDISYSLGYNDPGYFGKVFKKYEGSTPSVYKRENNCRGYNVAGSFGELMR